MVFVLKFVWGEQCVLQTQNQLKLKRFLFGHFTAHLYFAGFKKKKKKKGNATLSYWFWCGQLE